ncbi:MAG: acetyl-CoA carboxylase biotin carboxyl carrier protein, partial [Alphaproteobacteria bacterium]
ADPYVRVGSRISSGQTLCIIEAMKIMNPLDAEISGVIREVAVEDAAPRPLDSGRRRSVASGRGRRLCLPLWPAPSSGSENESAAT